MARVPEQGQGPICILGMPRSGTTWVGKIFDSHPATLYRHEPDSGGALNRVPLVADPGQGGTTADHMRAFLHELPRRRSLKVCGKRPIFGKDYLPGWRGAVHRGSIHAARLASVLAPMPVLEPVDGRAAEPRIVWKSIESTGRAGLVASADPGARVILVIRHPCGHIDSTLRGEAGRRFTDGCPAAEDWGIFEYLLETEQARRRNLTLDMLRATSVEERLAWRWLLFNEKAMEDLRGRPNSYIMRYEDLCDLPLAMARTLFMFAGLRWDGAVERFVHDSTTVDDQRYYSVYRDPAHAATAWRERLDADTVERIHDIVRDSAPGNLYAESRDTTVATWNGNADHE